MVITFLLALLELNVAQSQINEKRRRFVIELSGSVLPKATISGDHGKYRLKSLLQSSYELGINNYYSLSKSLFLSTGLQLVIGKYNYYMDLPESDRLKYGLINGKRILEDKGLWSSIGVPLTITKLVANKEFSRYLVSSGIVVRYSVLSTDFLTIGSFFDTSGRKIHFFTNRISPNNNKRPWIAITMGAGKAFVLENKNQFLINLVFQVSFKNFFRGDYSITMPGEPVINGTYKVNGSGIGLSVQYMMTGENKRLVRRYEKKLK